MEKDLILANDPGVKGALVLLTDKGKIYQIFETPFYREKKTTGKFATHVDGVAITKLLKPYKDRIRYAILEKVNAMKGQGVASMFTFGGNFRVVEGILNAWEIPVHFVRPKEWQKLVGYDKFKREKNTKVKSKVFAERWFGKDQYFIDNPDLLDKDGISDSVLIGLYGLKKIRMV